VATPSITSNQIAIDPITGVFYFRDGEGGLVSSSLNLLQDSNTLITTEDDIEVAGSLVVSGNLTVNGTTVTVSAESIIVEDKNIELANISSPSNTAADGGGITLKGTTDKTFNWSNSTGSWTSSENIDLASGKVFKINGTEVLSANAYTGSAAKWTNARVITLSGDLSGNVSIDGSSNVTLSATIVANSVALGTDTTGNYVSSLVAGTGISLSNNSGEGTTPTITLNASIDELTDVVISNAANGDFFRYNGSTWINDAINLSTDTIGDYVDHLVAGTGVTITNNSGEASAPTIAIGQSVATNANVSFNQVNAAIVGNVTGNLSGNVTGNLSGNVTGNLTGNSNGTHTGTVIGTASNALVWTNQRKITLDGDVTGNVFIDGSANVTITTTIASNSVALGTDTTGDYVANLISGTGITITDNSGEGMTPVIKVADSYTTNMVSNIQNSATSVSAYADTVGNTAYSNAVTYINNRTLDDLSGVTLSNAAANDVLLYNGSAWINDDINTTKLSDILTNNVLNGQVLLWDSDLSKWVNSILPEQPQGTTISVTKGNGVDTDFTIFHGFNTADVVVTVRSNVTNEVIQTRWSTTNSLGAYSTDYVTVNFTDPPDEDEMQITVYGAIQSTAVVITGRLDNLSGDVMISSPISGQSLSYNGTKWINRKLDLTTDMDDVVISGNATNQFLKFDGNTWVNASIPTINNLDDIGDVNVSSKSTNDLIKWDGNTWVAVTPGKSMVGLGNVDNTSDANKPVSTATQTALDLKSNLASPTFTGSVVLPSSTSIGNVSNTEISYLDGVTSSIQTQLNTKASSTSSPVITLNGDLTGNVTLSNLGSATLTATIAANSVALGSDTTGDYVSSLVAGTGIILTNNSGEGSTPTVAVNTSVIATKSYVDSFASGVNWHEAVKAATAGNLAGNYDNGTSGQGATLTKASNGSIGTIDNASVVAGDRILLKAQTDAKQNGIYEIVNTGNATTAWQIIRTSDFDNSTIPATIKVGDAVFVTGGDTNGLKGFIQDAYGTGANDSIVIGTDNISFTQFTGASTSVAGNGLSVTGNQFDVGTASASRIVVNTDNIDLATTGVTANTYKSVTVDVYGRVTAGTNPTTLSGYGITDALNNSLTSGYIYLGNSGNVATATAVSGDITITNTGNVQIASNTITNADINSAAAIALSKLATGTSAQVVLANASGVPTYATISGDIAVTNTGNVQISANSIVNADINSSAAIDLSKLASGTSGQIIIANASGIPTWVSETGDVTISDTGVTAIASNVIVNADINSAAAIDYSKLNLSNNITTTDLQSGAARAGFNSTLRTITTSNTLVSTDLAKLIVANSSSDITVTVSTSATFNDGDRIDLLRAGTGEVTIVGSGITINGTPGYRLRAQWSSATLIRLSSTTWVAVGDLKV
jgi:hypothetical protein